MLIPRRLSSRLFPTANPELHDNAALVGTFRRGEEANFLKSTTKRGLRTGETTPYAFTLSHTFTPVLRLFVSHLLPLDSIARARKLLEEPRLPARISRPPTRYQPPSAPSSTPRVTHTRRPTGTRLYVCPTYTWGHCITDSHPPAASERL